MSANAPRGAAPDPAGAVRPLPPRPSLEFERKQAKQLLDRLKHGDPDALTRVRRHKRDSSGGFKLADAHFTIAREYGFQSWPRLVEYLEALERQERSAGRQRGYSKEHHEKVAESLLAQHRNRRPSALFFATFVPRFYGRSMEEVFAADVTIDDARLVHARMQRYPSWNALMEHARSGPPEANEWTRSGSPDYRAGRAIRDGDVDELGRIIDDNPHLMKKVERAGHGVPVSILYTALAHELEVQTPEARSVTDYLVSRGAELEETLSAMLIGPPPWKTAAAVEYLIDRGADPEWIPPNGIPVLEHAICRYWNGAAVDAIARRVKPRQALWIAAGLGDVQSVAKYVGRNGRPTAAARKHRPDFTALSVGPTPFLPAADDAGILWEAFFVAALNQRFAVLDFLLEHGFPIDYAEWGQSMLHLAVGNRWIPLVEFLVRRGANVDLRGWQPGITAREASEAHFASHPDDPDARRLLELCGGRDPETVLRAYAEERSKQVRPAPSLIEAIEHAKHDAFRLGRTSAGVENLFIGVLRGGNLPVQILGNGGVDLSRIKSALGNRLDGGADPKAGDVPLDDAATAACLEARADTERRHQTTITVLHLLQVLLQPDEGPIAEWIRGAGGDLRKVRAAFEGPI